MTLLLIWFALGILCAIAYFLDRVIVTRGFTVEYFWYATLIVWTGPLPLFAWAIMWCYHNRKRLYFK